MSAGHVCRLNLINLLHLYNEPVQLPRPTVALINAEGEKFDSDNRVVEEALAQLIREFPRNTEPSHVLLKVVVVNHLYGAGIPRKNVERIADHITKLRIDRAVADGNAAIVDDIINCGLEEKYFSFASKFCSWHKPDAYPIYDRNVDECLWSYRQQYHFTTYRRGSYTYIEFVAILNAFRNVFGLNAVTFKQLDKFLWQVG